MVLFYYIYGIKMNPQKALKDCQLKIARIEKKVSQIRTHLHQVDSVIDDHLSTMTSDPMLIDHNIYNLSEIERLKRIQSDYQRYLMGQLQEIERLKKRQDMIESKMKSFNLQDERQKEKREMEDLIQLHIIKDLK